MTSQELFTNCQSAVSVGIVLMCAGEILMRTSMDTFERGGLITQRRGKAVRTWFVRRCA